jgi:hypothetical protein
MTNKREKPGQPTKYTIEYGERICELISTHAHGLPTLIRMYKLVDRQTIYNWLQKHREFFDSYMRAKEQQAHLLADEVLEVANDVPTYEDKEGNDRIDSGVLGRAKLQMDALRWSAGVLAPKFYKESKTNENSNAEIHADILKRKHEMDEKNKKEF